MKHARSPAFVLACTRFRAACVLARTTCSASFTCSPRLHAQLVHTSRTRTLSSNEGVAGGMRCDRTFRTYLARSLTPSAGIRVLSVVFLGCDFQAQVTAHCPCVPCHHTTSPELRVATPSVLSPALQSLRCVCLPLGTGAGVNETTREPMMCPPCLHFFSAQRARINVQRVASVGQVGLASDGRR